MTRPPPTSTLFPYTTLFRSRRLSAALETPMMRELSFCSLTARRSRRSEEHTSELQSRSDLVCRLLLEKKKFITKRLPLRSLVDLPVPAEDDARTAEATRGKQ